MFKSEVTQISESWCGASKLRHLVVFGASYCDIGYDSKSPHPTPERPLGVEYPGETYTEPRQANWVGYLTTKGPVAPLLTYCYGVGGAGVDGVQEQIDQEFLPAIGGQPEWAPWIARDTLFATFVGINNCILPPTEEHTIPELVRELLQLHGRLYDAGARNFLLIDLPPLGRTPMAPGLRDEGYGLFHELWNGRLREEASAFAKSHSDATVLIYSSWATFTRILDDPVAFGFQPEDAVKEQSAMWVDDLHPTSRVHEQIAKDMSGFLHSIPPHAATVQ